MADTQLANLALSAIGQNPSLRYRDLQLEAQQGRIVLRGTVRSYYHKQLAQESLRGIEGVHEIQNLLQVHWA